MPVALPPGRARLATNPYPTGSADYAREHPVCWSRSCRLPRPIWAAARLAVAIERVAVALLFEEEEQVPQNGPGIVRAHGVMRP